MAHEWPDFVKSELDAEDTEFNPISARVTLITETGEQTVDALVERIPGFTGDRAYFPVDSPADHQEMYVYENRENFENSGKDVGGYVEEELSDQFEILANR